MYDTEVDKERTSMMLKDFVLPATWVSHLREKRDALAEVGLLLKASIIEADSALPAVYILNGESIRGANARIAMSEWIVSRLFSERVDRYGLLACSPETLELAADFNKAKLGYADVYASTRKEANPTKSEALATLKVRQALISLGENHTDFKHVRAQVPCEPNSIEKVRWFITNERKSSRLTIADAINYLESSAENASSEKSAFFKDEIQRLSVHDHDKPVAQNCGSEVVFVARKVTS